MAQFCCFAAPGSVQPLCCCPLPPWLPGLGPELLIAAASKDVHTRDAAGAAIDGLKSWNSWARRCQGCGRGELAGAEGAARLSLSAGCRSRAFCGRDCQAACWGEHKKECKELAAL